MAEDFAVGIAALAHYGRSYLTQTDTVAPSCSVENEVSWDASIVNVSYFYYKCRTIEMAFGKSATYHKFFAYYTLSECARDFQFPYPPGTSACKGDERYYLSEIFSDTVSHEA